MGGKKIYVPNGRVNSTYRLTETDRLHVSILAHLGLWTNTSIADAFGVSRKTVLNCVRMFPAPLPWSHDPEVEERRRARALRAR